VRVILDECLPRRLIRDLADSHQVTTVPRQGWGGCTDRELLQRIPGEFDVWITMDSNLRYQINTEHLHMGIIVLLARNNRYETLKEVVPQILEALRSIANGQIVEIICPVNPS